MMEENKQQDEMTIHGSNSVPDEMMNACSRLNAYAAWHLVNEKAGLGPLVMIKEIYVQMAIIHAGQVALAGMISRGGVKLNEEELNKEITKNLEERLLECEKQQGIVITPSTVTAAPQKNGKEKYAAGGLDV